MFWPTRLVVVRATMASGRRGRRISFAWQSVTFPNFNRSYHQPRAHRKRISRGGVGCGRRHDHEYRGNVSRAICRRYSYVRMEAERRALDEIAARKRADDKNAWKQSGRRSARFPDSSWFIIAVSGCWRLLSLKSSIGRKHRTWNQRLLWGSNSFFPDWQLGCQGQWALLY
jgi:hypothetical protein